jgi:hypothetical protein
VAINILNLEGHSKICLQGNSTPEFSVASRLWILFSKYCQQDKIKRRFLNFLKKGMNEVVDELKDLVESNFSQTMSYKEFRELIDKLHNDGKVTGHVQSDELLEYSKLNDHRMNRWDKHFKVSDEVVEAVKSINAINHWSIITEGWCGDSAQVVPAVEKIALLNDKIQTHYLLRDDHPEIMDLFLTNGGRSIPVIVCLDHSGSVLWKWGPRPAEAQELVNEAKRSGMEAHEMKEKLHLWYARNNQKNLQQEFIELFSK